MILNHVANRLAARHFEAIVDLLVSELGFTVLRRTERAIWLRQRGATVDLQFSRSDTAARDGDKQRSQVSFLSATPLAELERLAAWLRARGVAASVGAYSDREFYLDAPDAFVDFVIEAMLPELADYGRGRLMEAVQLLLNGLMAGAVLAVPAIGFTTIYAVLRFPNFAVGGLATLGAYAGLAANTGLGWPLAAALLVAAVAAGALGVALDEVALARLRPRGGLTAAIGSVALVIVLENVARFVWGNDLLSYDLPIARDWMWAGLRVGPQQVMNAGIAVAVMAALFAALRFTRVGKMMRAVADNPALADLKGIDPHLVARLATGVGMGLAGLGGMLTGLDTGIDPLTGFRIMLSVFAAAVVGGLGSIPGAALGAVLVGMGEELSLLVLDPAYRTAVGFAAILVVLTFRPAGLLGERG